MWCAGGDRREYQLHEVDPGEHGKPDFAPPVPEGHVLPPDLAGKGK